ncbi:hypothetical protein AB0883_18700 [Micromonospora sp. NPDC047812]|uniref:hypothetical protein n=1 Tax=Micromonospora sp. NPDC047812 TaxID=3155742 RepID=UPI00345421C1
MTEASVDRIQRRRPGIAAAPYLEKALDPRPTRACAPVQPNLPAGMRGHASGG